jgi:coenzyme F420-reducing hydrogenase alpha subunit
LADKKEYAIYSGDILLGGAKTETAGQFMPKIIEQQIEEDGVKRSSFNNNPYMVGAIARLNNNFKNLNPEAKKIWKKTKLKLPSQNTFHNILAQAVEIVHCLEEVIGLTKKIPAFLQNNLNRKIQIKAGKGTGAVEAPRGTLFYFYEVGNNGLIKNCNIITPTAQNLARLEKDLEIWLPQLKKQGLDEDEIKKKIKMLIRAYDPCLTCATH